MLIREHHHRIADLELGVPDLSVRAGQAKQLLGPEYLLVELDGSGRVFRRSSTASPSDIRRARFDSHVASQVSWFEKWLAGRLDEATVDR